MDFINESQSFSIANEKIENKFRYGTLALGVAAAAVAADNGVVALDKYRSSKYAEIYDNGGQGNQSIIALPGCRNDGVQLANMYQTQLNRLGDSYFLSYPKRGFDMDSIKQNLLEARQQAKQDRLTVLASSMGGMVIAQALRDPNFRQQFGFIDRLVLDSSPSSAEHIKKHTRVAMGAAAILKNSWTANSLGGLFMFKKSRKRLAHDWHVSDRQAYEHIYKVSHAPLHVIDSQAKFMENTHFQAFELAGTVGEIAYVSSTEDHVIDTDAAAREYEKIFDTDVVRMFDLRRPSTSHAAGPEYQAKIIEALDLTNRLPGTKPAIATKKIELDLNLAAA